MQLSPTGILTSGAWRADALAAMDERHLVAWCDRPTRRARFAAEFQRFLITQPGSEVVVLHGRSIRTLDGLCDQIEHQLIGPTLEREIEGGRGLVEFLRHIQPLPGAGWPKARYILWNDADVLLRSDPETFGRVVDAMVGVAAENEFGEGDRLTLQRCVFLGGPMLERYARDARGQFRSWASDDAGGFGHAEPFWQLVTGLEQPPVLCRPIEMLTEGDRGGRDPGRGLPGRLRA